MSRKAISHTLGDCVRLALVFGIGYSVIAAVLVIVGNHPRPARTIVVLTTMYLLGATGAGAVVGVLLPFIRGRVTASLVGIIAAFPVAIALNTFVAGLPTTWPRNSWLAAATFAVIFGMVGGGMLNKTLRGNSS